MIEPVTHTLEVRGAVLRYDVRDSEPAGGQLLLMIGSPMGATGFGTVATHFADDTRSLRSFMRNSIDIMA